MTSFQDRERDFEARFKHDEEFRFKVTARRNHLLGLWAAGRLGLDGGSGEAYAREIIDAQFGHGDQGILAKLSADLGARDPSMTEQRIRFELAHFTEEAKQQLLRE